MSVREGVRIASADRSLSRYTAPYYCRADVMLIATVERKWREGLAERSAVVRPPCEPLHVEHWNAQTARRAEQPSVVARQRDVLPLRAQKLDGG